MGIVRQVGTTHVYYRIECAICYLSVLYLMNIHAFFVSCVRCWLKGRFQFEFTSKFARKTTQSGSGIYRYMYYYSVNIAGNPVHFYIFRDFCSCLDCLLDYRALFYYISL